VEILGLSMVISGQFSTVKPVCQLRDKPLNAKNDTEVRIPEEWELTPQQRAFIETFAEDEPKKQ